MKFVYLIDDIVIDFWSSKNFTNMEVEVLRRKCNPMVDLSKFSSNKKILSRVIVSCYNQGKPILLGLSKAIAESLFAIVILSKDCILDMVFGWTCENHGI